MSDNPDDRYAEAHAERQRHVSAVLQSQSRKKVVVAGPGTGKTFLFKEILKAKSRSLTLTFVNSLVEDLSLDLIGLSEVKTLHGFARGIMRGAVGGGVKVFPKLSRIVHEDTVLLKGVDIDYDSLFNNRNDSNEHVPFYKERRIYYGHYGFSDIIYAAVLYLERSPSKIPYFDQVLIDEFQDFNLLEVSLIDLLASKSPILIAGDDDQSLYFFKNADPGHLRERYSVENKEYSSFNLPHCSRCTRVIVDAVNDVVVAAKAEGLLSGRIDKPYLFFEDKKKEADCKRYPRISHVTSFSNQVPYFVVKAIREIAEERKEKFSVLIIAPTRNRCRKIARALSQKGFENVIHVEGGRSYEPDILDALILLAEKESRNLGWRIAARSFLSDDEFVPMLKDTQSTQTKFCDLVDKDLRSSVKGLLETYKKIEQGGSASPERLSALLTALNLNAQAMAEDALRGKIEASHSKSTDPATRRIPIKVTTIPSSKGLAEDYVFIVDFDDRFLLEKEGKCSDQKVFDLLVALTRARRKLFLVSSQAREPKFLTWIAKERIEKVKI